MHQAQPQINVEMLQSLLSHNQWILVTKSQRVLEVELLEKAVAADKVSAELVGQATGRKEPVPHKKFGPISKKDSEI